jgi:hypothetical protein
MALILGIVLISSPAWAEFIPQGNGTVLDTQTDLIWQQGNKHNNDGGRTWDQARDYCQNLVLGGCTDWRLPDKDELAGLVNTQRVDPAIDPVFAAQSAGYWTGNDLVDNSDSAWVTLFSYGALTAQDKDTYQLVRCVCGGHQDLTTPEAKADTVFDWLELEFPDILSPAPQLTYNTEGTFFRCYPDTDACIATIEDSLYYYNSTGVLHELGSVDQWVPYAVDGER